MPAHKLKIRYNLELQTNGAWRLQAWTAEVENITENVFVYQRKPSVPYETSQRDVFVNIAQPSDLAEYPEDVPGTTYPFFRKSSIDLEIDNSRTVYDTIVGMRSDFRELCKALDKVDP